MNSTRSSWLAITAYFTMSFFVQGCSDDTTIAAPVCVDFKAQEDTWITIDCDDSVETNIEIVDAGGGGSGGGIGVGGAPPLMSFIGRPCDEGKAIRSDGECVDFSVGGPCDWKNPCAEVDCIEAFCLANQCVRFDLDDGTECINGFGVCQGGGCKPISPQP